MSKSGVPEPRPVELGGGRVARTGATSWRLSLPALSLRSGYADAQLEDDAPLSRSRLPRLPGTAMRLRARFSHGAAELQGTAGFGFWNAPFADPRRSMPALPQAAWFFFASPPTDLPMALEAPGRGWFAGTVAAHGWAAWRLLPLALPLWLAQQIGPLRRRLWPALRRELGISFAPMDLDMTAWHDYALDWSRRGCNFRVDGRLVLGTAHSPPGPLGFVCWLDNQFLVLTPRGRFRAGTLAPPAAQWLEVADLALDSP